MSINQLCLEQFVEFSFALNIFHSLK